MPDQPGWDGGPGGPMVPDVEAESLGPAGCAARRRLELERTLESERVGTPAKLAPDYATTPADNWPSERGAGTHVCGTCMWFLPKRAEVERLGRCRRHAPSLSGYPCVYESDFCGDHKLK